MEEIYSSFHLGDCLSSRECSSDGPANEPISDHLSGQILGGSIEGGCVSEESLAADDPVAKEQVEQLQEGLVPVDSEHFVGGESSLHDMSAIDMSI